MQDYKNMINKWSNSCGYHRLHDIDLKQMGVLNDN